MSARRSSLTRTALLLALLAATAPSALAADPAPAPGTAESPAWRPEASERLVRLPAAVLDRQIDQEALASPLGRALGAEEQRLGLQMQGLADISAALELADGAQADELAHRYLVEKQAFIATASERARLERQKLQTKRRLLEGVLARLSAEDATSGESRKELVARQGEAKARMERALALADQLLPQGPAQADSRYAQDYEQKLAALDSLKRKIADHPMNRDPVVDGAVLGKADYLRHLVAATEGDLALLGMEEEMLGYMAKLVSLDALALAEKVDDPDLADSDLPAAPRVDLAVRYFVE